MALIHAVLAGPRRILSRGVAEIRRGGGRGHGQSQRLDGSVSLRRHPRPGAAGGHLRRHLLRRRHARHVRTRRAGGRCWRFCRTPASGT